MHMNSFSSQNNVYGRKLQQKQPGFNPRSSVYDPEATSFTNNTTKEIFKRENANESQCCNKNKLVAEYQYQSKFNKLPVSKESEDRRYSPKLINEESLRMQVNGRISDNSNDYLNAEDVNPFPNRSSNP